MKGLEIYPLSGHVLRDGYWVGLFPTIYFGSHESLLECASTTYPFYLVSAPYNTFLTVQPFSCCNLTGAAYQHRGIAILFRYSHLYVSISVKKLNFLRHMLRNFSRLGCHAILMRKYRQKKSDEWEKKLIAFGKSSLCSAATRHYTQVIFLQMPCTSCTHGNVSSGMQEIIELQW